MQDPSNLPWRADPLYGSMIMDRIFCPVFANVQMEEIMAWTTPIVAEVCVGMEVTSYESAEI
jgi:coenzyme PQQ precursor peptide PqqA